MVFYRWWRRHSGAIWRHAASMAAVWCARRRVRSVRGMRVVVMAAPVKMARRVASDRGRGAWVIVPVSLTQMSCGLPLGWGWEWSVAFGSVGGTPVSVCWLGAAWSGGLEHGGGHVRQAGLLCSDHPEDRRVGAVGRYGTAGESEGQVGKPVPHGRW